MSVNIYYSSESYWRIFPWVQFLSFQTIYFHIARTYCGRNSYNSSRRLNMLSSYNKFSEKWEIHNKKCIPWWCNNWNITMNHHLNWIIDSDVFDRQKVARTTNINIFVWKIIFQLSNVIIFPITIQQFKWKTKLNSKLFT